MVEVERGFTPWVLKVTKKLGRAVTGVQKMPLGTNAKIISLLSEKIVPDSFTSSMTAKEKVWNLKFF